MLSPQRLIEVLHSKTQDSKEELLAYWWRVDGARQKYAAELLALRGEMFLVPLVVRDGFTNPNAIQADLARLCSANRDLICAGREIGSPVVLVLLGLSSLTLAQVSSPIDLPEWFPHCGGRTVWVSIENVDHAAVGLLNSPEIQAEEIATALYRIEGLLVDRLRRVLGSDHRRLNGFIDVLKRSDEALRAGDFLAGCAEHLSRIAKPSGYRPSVREGRSLLARIIGMMSRSSPDDVGARAKALMVAINGEELRPFEALPVVLYRSVNQERDPGVRFARGVLATLFAASQLVTATAHASEYPEYPLALLHLFSLNIRSGLDWIIDQLESNSIVMPVDLT